MPTAFRSRATSRRRAAASDTGQLVGAAVGAMARGRVESRPIDHPEQARPARGPEGERREPLVGFTRVVERVLDLHATTTETDRPFRAVRSRSRLAALHPRLRGATA